MMLAMNPPPPNTPIEPVTEILHGVAITDPYRWLEDQNSLQTRKWLREQNLYARAHLDKIPGRERIRRRVEELLAVQVVSNAIKVDSRYFYEKRSPYQEQPAIMMRDGDSGPEVVLVDPGLQGDVNVVAKLMNISQDGRLIAYGVSRRADSSRTVEFLDVDRKQVLADRLPEGHGFNVQISPDGQGCYYSYNAANGVRPHYCAVKWHKFGTHQKDDPELFFAGDGPNIHLQLFTSAKGKRLGYLVSRAHESATCDVYVHDFVHKTPARRIITQMESIFQPSFVGDQLLALTDCNAPNLRIVAIDPEHASSNNWRDVISESERRIKDVAFVGSHICVNYVENSCSVIEAFDGGGHWVRTVPCPPLGGVQLPRRSADDETLFYNYSAFHQPPTIFSYHIPTGEQRVWAKQFVNFDSSSFHVEQVRYPSKDGTEIPMFLVARQGQVRSGPLPTFLTGYGGFGSVRTPKFNCYSTFLIEHGVLFALPSLRGGGEFGEEWHHAGKRHNRQNAFDDFIQAAEWLIANGYSDPKKIAIGGGSNGGLLVGAALTQRPDLFRAVVCMGPLLDMLRYHRFDSGHSLINEFGIADREHDFRHLQTYSPYHRVKDGISYPPVMLISGDADTSCNPMHARKMAARLQAATSSGRPIILDYNPNWGHAPVQPLSRRVDALTDRLAFICNELSVAV